MTWTISPVGHSLGTHGPDWDDLNARLFDGHPLLDSRYINGLLSLRRMALVVLCIEWCDDRIIGMCLLTPTSLNRWTTFLPSQAQLGPTLLGSVDDLQGLIRALPRRALAVEFLCVDPRFSKLPTCSFHHAHWQAQALTVAVELTGTYKSYWAGRSSNLRDNLRRYQRRATSDGAALEIQVHDTPATITPAVERYAALEGRGWKGKQGTALDSSPEQLHFFRQLMEAYSVDGQAYVFEMWHKLQLVASRLVIRQGQVVVILKTTFDESMSSIAPGRLQLRMLIEHGFTKWAGGLLEFYTSANDQQLSWATSQRMIGNFMAYRNGLAKRMFVALRSVRALQRTLGNHDPVKALNMDSLLITASPSEIDPVFRLLSDAVEKRNAEAGLDWYACQCRTLLHNPDSARFIGLKRGHHGVALLPANIDPSLSRIDGGVGALSTFYTTLYEPLFTPECVVSDVTPLIRALVKEAGRPSVMTFGPMDRDSHGYQLLRLSLRACGYFVNEHLAHVNWYLPVTQTWAEYLATRQGTLRNTIRRMQKKLDAENAVFEFLSEPEDVERGIAAYNQVYVNSWKQAEPIPGFMGELACACAKRGWLRLGLIWIGDRPIATQFWIVTEERAEIYKIAYDEAYKALAAGTVLTAKMIERAIDIDGVREIDYLVGDDKYKQQWMTHRRERWRLWAYDPRSRLGLARILRQQAASIKERLLKRRIDQTER